MCFYSEISEKIDVSTGLTPYNIYAVCENWVYTKINSISMRKILGSLWLACFDTRHRL